VLAALQSWYQPCTLTGALKSEDTEVMAQALRQLGFRIEVNWPEIRFAIHAGDRPVPAAAAEVFVGNSGTSMRFLTALCAVGKGRSRLDGVARMRARQIQVLLWALNSAGIHAFSEKGNGCPPVVIEANGSWSGTGATVRGDVSSQFVSALLMIGPFVALFHP